jgi:CheY-like chemotaxis protein
METKSDTNERKRVLIVDDESGFTRLLKLTLERTGRYSVREQNDATRALETAREFRPDLALLDIMMPKMDGGDVARQIKADPSLKTTRIVFLTAIVSQQEGTGTSMIGGFPFMAKPVSLDALVKCIEENLASPA